MIRRTPLHKVVFVVIMMSIVLSRLFLPSGANYDGSKSSMFTYIGYLIEDIGLAIGAISYLYYYSRKRNMSTIAKLWFVLYGYAVIMSPVSADFVLSLHAGVRGILHTFIGLLFSEYVNTSANPKLAFKNTIYFIYASLVISVISETITVVSFEYITKFGAGGSYIALIGFMVVIFINEKEEKKIIDASQKSQKSPIKFREILIRSTLSMIVIFTVLKMNSFTAIISFAGAIIVFMIYKRKYYSLLFVSLLTGGVLIMYIIPMLETGELLIARKNYDTLLHATGRFEAWNYCLCSLLDGTARFYGHGFMADFDLLKSAANMDLSHTCHNSFLTLAVGLGVFGGVYYFIFLMYHFYLLGKRSIESRVKEYQILFYISFLIFGIASPLYPGQPTPLIWISIILGNMYNEKNSNNSI